MYDDLSRIEGTYGSVAEFNRVREEEDYATPSLKDEAESEMRMMAFKEKERILNGVPSDCAVMLKTLWDEAYPKKENYKERNDFIYAERDFCREHKKDLFEKLCNHYNVTRDDSFEAFYRPKDNTFSISVDYQGITEVEKLCIKDMDYETFKNVFRDLSYLKMYPSVCIGINNEEDKRKIISNCTLGKIRMYDLKNLGYETEESLNQELKDNGFTEETYKDIIKKDVQLSHINDENFHDYVDMEGINDSMLLSSGTIIAEYKDTENDITLSLEVRGSVDITFKGKEYRNVSEFPEELIELIKNNPDWFSKISEIEDSYITDNNWFELFILDDEGDFITSDVVDIENMSIIDVYEYLKEEAKDYIKEKEKENEDREL